MPALSLFILICAASLKQELPSLACSEMKYYAHLKRQGCAESLGALILERNFFYIPEVVVKFKGYT